MANLLRGCQRLKAMVANVRRRDVDGVKHNEASATEPPRHRAPRAVVGSHPNYSGLIAEWLGLVRVSDYVLRRRALCRYMWASASRRSCSMSSVGPHVEPTDALRVSDVAPVS
jgi:hypothetical protein